MKDTKTVHLRCPTCLGFRFAIHIRTTYTTGIPSRESEANDPEFYATCFVCRITYPFSALDRRAKYDPGEDMDRVLEAYPPR